MRVSRLSSGRVEGKEGTVWRTVMSGARAPTQSRELLCSYPVSRTRPQPRNYDLKSFRNDLKDVLRRAGVDGKPVLMLIEDHQVCGCVRVRACCFECFKCS